MDAQERFDLTNAAGQRIEPRDPTGSRGPS